MYCEKCGAEVTGNFCSRCGNEINNQFQNTQSAPIIKKSNTGLIVLVSIIGVITLAVVILFLSILFIDSPKNTKYNSYKQPEPSKNEIIEEPKKEIKKNAAIIMEEEELFELNYSDNSYLYPTNEEYLSMEDLYLLSKDEVALLRNELYARHGYSFKNETYRNFFMDKTWYYPDPNLTESGKVESRFNSYEKANKEIIIQYEKDMGWR